MTTQFALDLRLARRKAGLTQGDCAHLLDVPQSRVSDFERGVSLPSLPELCALTLVFNRHFESLTQDELEHARAALQSRVRSLPQSRRLSVETINRGFTVRRLKRTLRVTEMDHGSGA